MRNTKHKKLEIWLILTCLILVLVVPITACAHIRLSNDWGTGLLPNGRRIPEDQDEGKQLDKAAMASVISRTTTPDQTHFALELSFKLFLDQTKFYVQPALYMPRSHPGEVCTSFGKVTAYECKEGQRQTQACHIGLFDAQFREAGWYTIRINETIPVFCNAVPAMGVYDANQNEMLVTVQYFEIDHKAATQGSEIGSGWKRMTVLLRLKSDNGKINVEQDDRCLGNPNQIDTVPDAKRALRNCKSSLSPSSTANTEAGTSMGLGKAH